MRLRKRDLRVRVKGSWPIRFSREQISAYGGLEFFRRFLFAIDMPRRLREALAPHGLDGDYGAARLALAIVALIVVGGLRISHIAFLGQDPVVLRFVGLKRLPSDRTLGRWLERFSSPALLSLEILIRDLVYEQVERSNLNRLTLDIDGTVLRTGVRVEGTARGYNPHHPKDKSYYPLTAHIAELGQILRVRNRPGNVNDAHGAVGFLRVIVEELRSHFGGRMPVRLRMDGAFFTPQILQFLDDRDDLGWAMKVPLWQWLGIREEISRRHTWVQVAPGIEGFVTAVIFDRPRWPQAVPIVVYRKHVSHRTRKNFQLDLFTPDDGHYEYSAVASNLGLGIRNLWKFMAGRGAHEKTLGDLKTHFAFDVIPSQDRHANRAWQMLSVLTLNLVRSFQIQLGAPRRKHTAKYTYLYEFQSLRTLGFELIRLPARLVTPAGRAQLRFAIPPPARRRVERALQHLEAA